MAIVNRDLDASEQLATFNLALTLAATSGGTYVLASVPWPCEVKRVVVTAKSLSGTPSLEVEGYRFSGGVTINSAIMAAQLIPAFGTSGAFSSASLGVAGSTQVQLAASDSIVASVTGANSAADIVNVAVVVKKLQDIASSFGASS